MFNGKTLNSLKTWIKSNCSIKSNRNMSSCAGVSHLRQRRHAQTGYLFEYKILGTRYLFCLAPALEFNFVYRLDGIIIDYGVKINLMRKKKISWMSTIRWLCLQQHSILNTHREADSRKYRRASDYWVSDAIDETSKRSQKGTSHRTEGKPSPKSRFHDSIFGTICISFDEVFFTPDGLSTSYIHNAAHFRVSIGTCNRRHKRWKILNSKFQISGNAKKKVNNQRWTVIT